MERIQIIQENNKWCFKIFPSNSNTQPLGISNYFNEESLCYVACNEFMDFVTKNKIDSSDSQYVKIFNDGSYNIIDNDNNILFKSVLNHSPTEEYNLKKEFDTTINSIYNNIIKYKNKI